MLVSLNKSLYGLHSLFDPNQEMCYLTGEWQHDRKKAIKIKKHGRLSVSLFRYGLDHVQMAILRLIGFGKKEEFKKVLAILRKKKPDRTRAL